MPHKILLYENDVSIARSVAEAVTSAGHDVEIAADLLRPVDTPPGFDMVVLDVDVPGENGFAVCQTLRDYDADCPILVVSARSEIDDKLTGFQSGADDYVTKPFDMRELLARIQVLLRRAVSRSIRALGRHHFGDITIDFFKGTVFKGGIPVALSVKELYLLRYLLARPEQVVSREELLTEVWGYRALDTRTVDMHVAAVRRKIEDDPTQPRFIRTARGVGYQFSNGLPVTQSDSSNTEFPL